MIPVVVERILFFQHRWVSSQLQTLERVHRPDITQSLFWSLWGFLKFDGMNGTCTCVIGRGTCASSPVELCHPRLICCSIAQGVCVEGTSPKQKDWKTDARNNAQDLHDKLVGKCAYACATPCVCTHLGSTALKPANLGPCAPMTRQPAYD